MAEEKKVAATRKRKTATSPTPAPPEAAPRKRAPAAKKTPVRRTTKSSATQGVSDQERYKMIQDAAYYLAEKRGFAPGHAQEDWAEAERQVDEQLKAQAPNAKARSTATKA